MSPTEISAKLTNKERFVGTHFWNPAHLIPLVEVVRTEASSDAVVDAVMELLTRAGKSGALQKDVPGSLPTACSTPCGVRPYLSLKTA